MHVLYRKVIQKYLSNWIRFSLSTASNCCSKDCLCLATDFSRFLEPIAWVLKRRFKILSSVNFSLQQATDFLNQLWKQRGMHACITFIFSISTSLDKLSTMPINPSITFWKSFISETNKNNEFQVNMKYMKRYREYFFSSECGEPHILQITFIVWFELVEHIQLCQRVLRNRFVSIGYTLKYRNSYQVS